MDEYIECYMEGDLGWPVANSSYHEVLREFVLTPEYSRLSDGEIDQVIEGILSGMSPEEAEGFWNTLGNLGRSVGRGIAQVAPTILPAAGTVVGTMFGGPAGAAIGGTLGRVAGQAVGQLGGRPRQPAQPAPQSVQPSVGAPISHGGTSATAQIMSLLQNPALLQSILGQVLGNAGVSNVPVGTQGAAAPFGAFMNALSQLATQSAIEANADQENSSGVPTYLLTERGDFKCDVAVPAERAAALMESLREQ